MKKIAIGIIGCGKIAQMRHIPEYAANANAKLCGFFDVNLQRAQELADQYGTKAYGSYQELLADPQIEAVSVLTPNFTHAEITIAALKAGKHPESAPAAGNVRRRRWGTDFPGSAAPALCRRDRT